MLSMKPTTPKEENSSAENWQNVAEDTSKALSLGITLGTAASSIIGGGLPIIVGTAIGAGVSMLAAVYDLTRDYPGLSEEEMACVEALDAIRDRLKNKRKPLRSCKDCHELPRVGHDLDACVKIRERLAREEEPVKPCHPENTRDETTEEDHKNSSVERKTQQLHPELAKRFNEFKQYQRPSHLKQFTSKPTPSFWDNYVVERGEKNAKPVPLKRFTTPSYRKNDEN